MTFEEDRKGSHEACGGSSTNCVYTQGLHWVSFNCIRFEIRVIRAIHDVTSVDIPLEWSCRAIPLNLNFEVLPDFHNLLECRPACRILSPAPGNNFPGFLVDSLAHGRSDLLLENLVSYLHLVQIVVRVWAPAMPDLPNQDPVAVNITFSAILLFVFSDEIHHHFGSHPLYSSTCIVPFRVQSGKSKIRQLRNVLASHENIQAFHVPVHVSHSVEVL
mmetsp:Transcript_18319/g.28539  ORF Transcript_18319/g.28539 Transcript_18319/m.28539 type:complete len:217 (-) Transcript_18319:1420-2070(-)